MTDYKQLCAELLETIDLLTVGDSRPESAAISSARTMLAQPEQAGEGDHAGSNALADELLERRRASRLSRAVLAAVRAAHHPIPNLCARR
jgi:hypothetical protein